MLVGRCQGGYFCAHGAENFRGFHVATAIKTLLECRSPSLFVANRTGLFPGLAFKAGELVVNLNQGISDAVDLLIDRCSVRIRQLGGSLIEPIQILPLCAEFVDFLPVFLPVLHHERIDPGARLAQFIDYGDELLVGIAFLVSPAQNVSEPPFVVLSRLLKSLSECRNGLLTEQVYAAVGRLPPLRDAGLHPLEGLHKDLL